VSTAEVAQIACRRRQTSAWTRKPAACDAMPGHGVRISNWGHRKIRRMGIRSLRIKGVPSPPRHRPEQASKSSVSAPPPLVQQRCLDEENRPS